MKLSNCPCCGTTFQSRGHGQRFCSPICQKKVWRKSAKYKACKARYRKSAKGKAYLARYRKSAKYKAYQARYKKSAKGKAYIRAQNAAWRARRKAIQLQEELVVLTLYLRRKVREQNQSCSGTPVPDENRC